MRRRSGVAVVAMGSSEGGVEGGYPTHGMENCEAQGRQERRWHPIARQGFWISSQRPPRYRRQAMPRGKGANWQVVVMK